MMFLREVFSVVLLFAQLESETGNPTDGEVDSICSNSPERTGPDLCPGKVMNADSRTFTFFVPSACTRRMPRPDTWVRSPIPDLHLTVDEDQNLNVLPMMKDALRLITGYLDVETRAKSEVQTMVMMIGVRG